MLGARQLSSVALALCLYHASAFAGVVSARGGARSNAIGGARANTALPPRAIEAADQQLGKKISCSPPCRADWLLPISRRQHSPLSLPAPPRSLPPSSSAAVGEGRRTPQYVHVVCVSVTFIPPFSKTKDYAYVRTHAYVASFRRQQPT